MLHLAGENCSSTFSYIFKVRLSPSKKNLLYFLQYENCFLVHLKSSFRSQDIQIFVLTFWSCRKNGLIRKIMLVLNIMMSQPGQQRIAIHIAQYLAH